MSPTEAETGHKESAPLEGVIGHTKYDDLVLLTFLTWEEDGETVVRAKDFDLYAVGDDCEEAVQKLVQEAYALFFALGDLAEDEATEDERALYVRLGGPIVEAFKRAEKDRAARFVAISFPRFRRRGHDHSDWRPGSSRTRSPVASPA